MVNEQKIRELAEELAKLTVFIGEHGTSEQLHNKDWSFACNVSDALEWVLGEISTESFESINYLKLDQLRRIAREIHKTLGKKRSDYS